MGQRGFQDIARSQPEYSTGDLAQYKKDFAYHFLRDPQNAFKAALKVFPTDRQTALRAAAEWPNDNEVIVLQNEFLEQHGEEAFLPTRVDFLAELWKNFKSDKVEMADKIKIADIYAKARGFYPEKVQVQTNETVNITNKVMVVRASGSDEEWERRLQQQQNALLHE